MTAVDPSKSSRFLRTLLRARLDYDSRGFVASDN
jgi:hypothetical protein